MISRTLTFCTYIRSILPIFSWSTMNKIIICRLYIYQTKLFNLTNTSFIKQINFTSIPTMQQSTKAKYQVSGRGGAGNYHRTSTAQKSSTKQEKQPIIASSGCFRSGIGGAGNFHKLSSLDVGLYAKDLACARSITGATRLTAHTGIGGKGNIIMLSRNSSVSSTSSATSTASSVSTECRILLKARYSNSSPCSVQRIAARPVPVVRA
jgi:hypothetical protein